LILFADKVYKVIPPQKGRKHILSIISNILTADYVPAESKLIKHGIYDGNFQKKISCFLLSDFEDEYDSKMLRVASKNISCWE
jgi:uncharacterized protein (DUF58 family)